MEGWGRELFKILFWRPPCPKTGGSSVRLQLNPTPTCGAVVWTLHTSLQSTEYSRFLPGPAEMVFSGQKAARLQNAASLSISSLGLHRDLALTPLLDI